jgi:hypothetical protein
LLQQVSKELVKDYSNGLKKGKFGDRLSYLNDPAFKEPLSFNDFSCPKLLIKLFKKREADAIVRVLKAIESFKSKGLNSTLLFLFSHHYRRGSLERKL